MTVWGITLVYLALFKLFGFGASGSQMYADPFESTLTYLQEMGAKGLLLLGAFVFGSQPMLRYLPEIHTIPFVFGGIATALLGIALLICVSKLDRKTARKVKWLGAAMGLSMLPGLSGSVDGRACLIAAVAFASLSGILLGRLLSKPKDGKRRRLSLAVGLLLVIASIDGKPLMSRLALDLFRNTPLKSGDSVQHNGIAVTVMQRTEQGPTEVRLTVPYLADEKKTCVVSVKDELLVKTPLPSIGKPLVIPHA